MTEWPIKDILLSDITPHPQNPYRHPERQQAALEQSFAELGNVGVAIYNARTGHLIDGHARLEYHAAKGATTLACRVVEWDEATEKKALLTINRSGYLADWDEAGILGLLSEFSANDALLSNLYTESDRDALLKSLNDSREEVTPNEETEPPDTAPSRTKTGDVWTLGPHKLLVGDSEDLGNIGLLLGQDKARVMFTDPPYNLVTGGGTKFRSGLRGTMKGLADADITDFKPEAFLALLPHYFEKDVVSAFIFCNDALIADYQLWSREQKASFRLLTWHKGNPIPIGGCHWPDCEYLLFLRRGALWNDKNDGGDGVQANRSRLLDYPRKSQPKSGHPTPKPVDLIINQLWLTTNAGDLVADPYLGGGSTLMACERSGRVCRGIEQSPPFADLCLAWWEQETGLVATLEP